MGTKWLKVCTCAVWSLGVWAAAAPAFAGDIYVAQGESLQAAIDGAQPGDRILLAPGATFTGNFRLPNKGSSESYITIRSAAHDSLLPAPGVRVSPADAPNLPRIQSPNTTPALTTAAGAHHWRLELLEFAWNDRGFYDIITLGWGDSSQTTLASVPHHLILDRVYIHGHPVIGQKRALALHSGATWVINCYISDIKGVGFESQAIMGYNGPGPWVVVNNYLEAATENVLIGGASPRIQNLIPSDLEFRRNHMAKPLSWRSPILATPAGVNATAGTGGSLPAGTYSYRIVGWLKTAQDTQVLSPRSSEVLATVGSSGKVTLSWTPVPNATKYRIYRGTAAGAQDRYFESTTASYIDSGQSAGIADSGKSISGHRWTTKNIFELKVGQRVVVDGNVMENCWLDAQTGYAVLITPRNQDGTSPWVYVRDVTFTNNLVRHSGSAINILGYDSNNTSQQTQRITIRNNLFYDISAVKWGGPGRFVLVGDAPRDIVIDHNTVNHDGSSLIFAYGGTVGARKPIYGFVVTNNMFRHNQYGIMGDGEGFGNTAINMYFPDAVISRNTLAGGSASKYPPTNEFPSLSTWQAQFVDFADSDYRLVPSSPYRGTGTDGLDLGADVDAVEELASMALSGRDATDPTPTPVTIVTTTLPAAVVLSPYSTQLSASGGSGSYVWSLASGQLPAGLTLSQAGTISGTPTTVGTSSFTVRATDGQSASNTATKSLQITVGAVPPVVSLTSPASGSTITGATVPLGATASDADGVVVRVDFFAGTVAIGTSTSAPWTATWTDVQPGDYQITAVATDNQGLSATSAPASITVTSDTPPPPPPPSARPEGEIVLFAADVTRLDGSWKKVSDATAAGGVKLASTDAGFTSTSLPQASPAHYFEAVFDAPAATPYRVWLRLKAANDSVANDSVWVQFSDSVSTTGAPLYRIDTTEGLVVNLENCSNCGVGGWGWQDRGYWVAPMDVAFAAGGTHAVRVQVREDGVELDQIVLTPVSANAEAPGPVEGDTQILTKSALPTADFVLYAAEIPQNALHGNWSSVVSPGSPQNTSVLSIDLNWSSTKALASPAHYFDVTFAAVAGKDYRVWVRLKAAGNSLANDSVWLQFSHSIGRTSLTSFAVYRIGSTSAMARAGQTCKTCTLSNWGWTDRAYGVTTPTTVRFGSSGVQTLRIQTREDGVEIDQVVLSPLRYKNHAPGASKDDATIVSKSTPGSLKSTGSNK